ncbi:DUF1127 domain-containing protein [Agrobacterium vaccinii]|uniref:DUF1127 domain-containing protein n=1 Tax=Agrobacterium vaccinii TaxID=2735528 RepID=UPI001E5ACDBC|nr:DUF1127 domain-containing protein [Agrobacterium vaccinii]UHS61566.1 DUF1127 domain-containing protein [Agrobacterium vaccinii]
MRKLDQYLSTIDTMYPDSYARERVFRDDGEMVSPAPFQAEPRTVFERLLGVFGQWQRKRNTRLALRELTAEELADIGITRQDAMREFSKARLFSLPRSF